MARTLRQVLQHGGIVLEKARELGGVRLEPGGVLLGEIEEARNVLHLVRRYVENLAEGFDFVLGDNAVGLRMLHAEKKIWRRAGQKMDRFIGSFSLTSATNLLSGLTEEDNLIHDLRQCFVYS